MKILVVGDIHGNFNKVLAEVEKRMNSFEHIVFLGDYVDSFDNNQNGYPMINGFNRMVEMDNGKFHILIGNHDLSYLSDDRISGHRYDFAQQYREMFLNNLDKMDVCCQLGDYVFSHAGISSAWVALNNISDPSDVFLEVAEISREDYNKMSLVDQINLIFHEKQFFLFDYYEKDYSMVGNSPRQGPLWIRPNALWENMAFDKQIVGHTEIKPEMCPFTFEEGDKKLIVLDSPTHFNFLELEA
jgi:hypothetical protein